MAFTVQHTPEADDRHGDQPGKARWMITRPSTATSWIEFHLIKDAGTHPTTCVTGSRRGWQERKEQIEVFYLPATARNSTLRV